MARVFSIHEYVLKRGVAADVFEAAVDDAARRGCFDLPGLVDYRFVRRLRGSQPAHYAAIWTYESRDAWAKLWGNRGNAKPKDRFPSQWEIWEDEILAPLLDRDPQFIEYAAYEEYRG
jgi:hypothetical protein